MSFIDDWNAFSGDATTGTADYGQPPHADNSNGSPPQQVSDPTGNGFGWITGSISKALDYAIQRDKNQMQLTAYQTGYRPTVGTINGRPATNGAIGDRQLLFIGLAVVAVLVLKGK